MKLLNVIIVYDKSVEHILMCKREKEPFKGKYNLVGGKVESNEDIDHAAYRELYEETGITKNDIVLTHFMDMKYYIDDYELEIYVGRLNKEVNLIEEVNHLYWMSVNEDFFDYHKFAGEGNIGHMIREINIFQQQLLK